MTVTFFVETIFTYVAPEHSPIYTEENNELALLNEKITEILSQYPTAELFVAVDLNARIGNLQDFIPFDDIDFVFGDTDYPTDPFTINRQSKDDTCNRFGMSLIELCCTHGIHTLNGRIFDDKNGDITFCLLLGPPGFNCWFSSAPVFQWCCSTPQGSPGVGRNTFLSSPHLCFIIEFICDLFVSRDDPLMS